MSVTPESVRDLLSSEDFGERLRAVNQFRQLEPAIAFELIQIAANDKSARIRYAAISQLASVGGEDRAKSLEILRDLLLNDPEPDVQAAAADSLGALKLTEAFEDLQNLYQNTSEWLVQFSIIAALGELSDPRAFDLLETALKSDSELVQTAAIGSLGELGDRRAVPLLLPYVSHHDWQIRYRLVRALSQFKDAETQAALQQLATDEAEQVAQEAQATLKAA